jgi:hypothetical protein
MDQSFVIISNNSNNNSFTEPVDPVDGSFLISENDGEVNKLSLENLSVGTKTTRKPLVAQDSHDINDSYDFNVNEMMSILTEKNNCVINSAKLDNVNLAADESKVNNRNEAVKALNEKKSTVMHMVRMKNEVDNIQDKLKAGKIDAFSEKAPQTKSVDDGYVNDTNDMSVFVKLLNQKKSSILEMARFDADSSALIADSAKESQKSKRLAAVLAANKEDLNLINVGKDHYFLNQMNNIDNSDDNDYKKINETKSQVNQDFFNFNQSETQILLENLKTNRKEFLETIMD